MQRTKATDRRACPAPIAIVRALLGVLLIATPTLNAEAPTPAPDLLRVDGVDGRPGGEVVVALRAEPKTLQPLLALDSPSRTVVRRLHGELVRLDPKGQSLVPALVTSWQVSEDGKRISLALRRGVRFSDGEPFDADDVLFTFRVLLDEAIGAPARDALVLDGAPVEVEKRDAYSVEIRLPKADATGVGLLAGVAVLPEHKLAAAYREGRFADAWSLGTPAEDVVGLGPFRLVRHRAGERLELARNPHYWKIDAQDRPLPYLDRLIFQMVADEDAQVLRFQAGESHLIDRLSAESFEALLPVAGKQRLRLLDAGAGLSYHALIFNQNPPSETAPEGLAARQTWFRALPFRRAVSSAIDRAGIAQLVYRGRATPLAGPVPPGNRRWVNSRIQPPERSLAAAREALGTLGMKADPEGVLRDATGAAVRFGLMVNAGNDDQRAMATIVQDDLRQLGITVEIEALPFGTVVDRLLTARDYDAVLLGLGGGDLDPNAELGIWLSDGGSHFWHLDQAKPATPWEAEVDRLLERQAETLDAAARKALFDKAQSLIAENMPFLFLVSPNVLIGAAEGLVGVEPALVDHPTLWNADLLYWRRDE